MSIFFVLASFCLIEKMKPGFYQELDTLKPYGPNLINTFNWFISKNQTLVYVSFLALHAFEIKNGIQFKLSYV